MAERWANIKDFAAERGSTINAVKAYIKRQDAKEKIPEKDLRVSYGFMAVRVGSPIYEKIDKKYPMPKKVEVVQDTELREKYEKILEKSLRQAEEIATLKVQATELHTTQMLLESATKDRDHAIEDRDKAAEQVKEAVKARQDAEKFLNVEKDRADAAEAKIAEMKSAGLWQRIRNKW